MRQRHRFRFVGLIAVLGVLTLAAGLMISPQRASASAPATCSAILFGGGSVGDGIYTIDPAQNGSNVSVYCDMTTDGGGWTLAGYGAQANLGGSLTVANGSYDAAVRTGSANIASVALAQGSTKVALSWSNGTPTGNLGTYGEAVRYSIPNPAGQTLAPVGGGYNCTDPAWAQVTVTPIVGAPNLPATMYTRTASLGAVYGMGYGLVLNQGNPQCDWTIDGQPFKAVYLGINSPTYARGIAYEPGGSPNQIIPNTMAIWFRSDAPAGPTTLGATAWEGQRPYAPVSTPAFSPLGAIAFYNYIPSPGVPGAIDSGWAPCGPGNPLCPSASTIGLFGPSSSRLGGSLACGASADYTFYQAFVSIPFATTISEFKVVMSGADDGARVAIYNSAHPGGVVLPGAYIFLGGAQSTTDLSTVMVAGEVNRVVITQMDNCATGNNLQSAQIFLNGTVITPPPSDTTPPVITPTVTGTLGDNDWYTSDVNVSWTMTDDESAITSTTGCDATTITVDAASVTLTCEATSAGGTASESVTLKRDATAPEATASRTPAANANGWNNSDVTVSFSGTDNLSGVASCDDDVVLGEGAGQSASGTCTDNAGNVSDPASVTDINVDLTAPVVTVTGTTDGASYLLGGEPTVGCSTSDALSGVDADATATVSGGPVGTFTVTCEGATDLAGNAASATAASYTVTYDFCGFKQPLLAPVQVFKTGSTVPVKFCVQDAAGTFVPGVVAEVYANGVLQGTAKQTDDGYHFNLRTKGMSKGPLTIEVRLDDGSTHSIEVGLK